MFYLRCSFSIWHLVFLWAWSDKGNVCGSMWNWTLVGRSIEHLQIWNYTLIIISCKVGFWHWSFGCAMALGQIAYYGGYSYYLRPYMGISRIWKQLGKFDLMDCQIADLCSFLNDVCGTGFGIVVAVGIRFGKSDCSFRLSSLVFLSSDLSSDWLWNRWVRSRMNSLDKDERIAQLFQNWASRWTIVWDAILSGIMDYQVGLCYLSYWASSWNHALVCFFGLALKLVLKGKGVDEWSEMETMKVETEARLEGMATMVDGNDNDDLSKA
ncbi:hypothetical protein L6452_18696 [Arctium lappa]|uniref:Uncharacterized protein n=1 Tax=Arctium lappa TaxID=4217 RepID=A0ACB9C706_ARCLA|nr:hypothetical protein L6452_18696 [Arctium lappa]